MARFSANAYQAVLLLWAYTLIIAGCQPEPDEEQNPLSEDQQESAEVRPEVLFAVADDQPIYQYIESQGVVQANQSVQLMPKISGYVDHSYITAGKRVAEGQTLLTFDRGEYAMAVDEAKNKYIEAKQKYDLEMSMRSGRSVGQGAGVHNDNGEPLVRITTGLAQAEVNLKQAQLNLSYATIKAPFAADITHIIEQT